MQENNKKRGASLSSAIGWLIFILVIAGGPLLNLLRSALGGTGPGVNRLRRFNITLRYANRRPVTLLAQLQRAKSGCAGKQRARPSLRVTSVHVWRPRKEQEPVNQQHAWARVLRTPTHGMCVRAATRRAGSGQACAVARGPACTASVTSSPRARTCSGVAGAA